MPFEEIAPVLDRSPAAARQLASRARRRVRGTAPVSDTNAGAQREVVEAFLAASRAGDFDALMAVLDPDVVLRVDGGRRPAIAPAAIHGAQRVARFAAERGPRFARVCRPALVNGAVGVVARTERATIAVAGMTIAGGRIVTIDLVLDPDKLRAA
jgi:ketosteroid isomerase-like protein